MDATRTRPFSITWLKVASIWCAIALFNSAKTVISMRAEGMHHAWTRLFLTIFLAWLPWALATPLIVRLGRRYPQTSLRPTPGSLIHLAACLLIGLVSTVWTASFDLLLNPWALPPPSPTLLHLVISYFDGGLLLFLILYAGILVCIHMLDSSRIVARQQVEAAQLNEQLSKAQLNALQRQIEPHFLFNTLNAIAGLVREQHNDAAVNMIAALSEFLREALQDSNQQQVSLAKEMDFVQKYLSIQKVRFADRLQLSILVPEELLPARVPRFTLQPVVENAFKHGISKRAQGGAIRIAASRSSDMLTLSVYNDGPKLATECAAQTEGTGISNLRNRLKGLYGDAFQLKMQNGKTGGVEVSVSLPFKAA